MPAASFYSPGATISAFRARRVQRHPVIFLLTLILSALVVSSCSEPETALSPEIASGLTVLGTDHSVLIGVRAKTLLYPDEGSFAIENRRPEWHRLMERFRTLLGGLKADQPGTGTIFLASADIPAGIRRISDDPGGLPELTGLIRTPRSLYAIEDALSTWPGVERIDSADEAIMFRVFSDHKDAHIGISEHAIVGTTEDETRLSDLLGSTEDLSAADTFDSNDIPPVIQSVGSHDAWVVFNSIDDFLVDESRQDESPLRRGLFTLARAARAVGFGIDTHKDGITLSVYLLPGERVRASDMKDLVEGLVASAALGSIFPPDIERVIQRSKVSVRDGQVRLTVRVDNHILGTAFKNRD